MAVLEALNGDKKQRGEQASGKEPRPSIRSDEIKCREAPPISIRWSCLGFSPPYQVVLFRV